MNLGFQDGQGPQVSGMINAIEHLHRCNVSDLRKVYWLFFFFLSWRCLPHFLCRCIAMVPVTSHRDEMLVGRLGVGHRRLQSRIRSLITVTLWYHVNLSKVGIVEIDNLLLLCWSVRVFYHVVVLRFGEHQFELWTHGCVQHGRSGRYCRLYHRLDVWNVVHLDYTSVRLSTLSPIYHFDGGLCLVHLESAASHDECGSVGHSHEVCVLAIWVFGVEFHDRKWCKACHRRNGGWAYLLLSRWCGSPIARHPHFTDTSNLDRSAGGGGIPWLRCRRNEFVSKPLDGTD